MISVYNGSLDQVGECGSFTVVAERLREGFRKLGVYTEDRENFPVIFPECLNARRQFPIQIPFLASEYSLPPRFVVDWLHEYDTPIIAISDFARQNLINGGIHPNRIHTVHLGSDSNLWYRDGIRNKRFTFLTVNSSNDRSAFEELVEAWREFTKINPSPCLVIKDGENEKFKNWLLSQNIPNIIYDDRKLTQPELRKLYSSAAVHIYFDHSTSAGMTPLDSALCGTPTMVTWGSALKEYHPDWSQPFKIKTKIKPLDNEIINKWNNFGINSPPPNFYPPGTTRECIEKDDIIPALHYAYDNYLELEEINKKHREYIKNNLTWEATCIKILKVLSNE